MGTGSGIRDKNSLPEGENMDDLGLGVKNKHDPVFS
jgi:hypothetical protein